MVSRDSIDRKRRGEKLQQRESCFREYFANVPVGMFIADQEGRFLYVNKAFCSLIGYDEQQLLSPEVNFRTLTHPEYLGVTITGGSRSVDRHRDGADALNNFL